MMLKVTTKEVEGEGGHQMQEKMGGLAQALLSLMVPLLLLLAPRMRSAWLGRRKVRYRRGQ